MSDDKPVGELPHDLTHFVVLDDVAVDVLRTLGDDPSWPADDPRTLLAVTTAERICQWIDAVSDAKPCHGWIGWYDSTLRRAIGFDRAVRRFFTLDGRTPADWGHKGGGAKTIP